MITRISLKNWTSHRNTEINFGGGANIFLGPMGSGKTSVLDAIAFALYGSKAPRFRDSSLSDVISYGKEEASVELELELEGKKLKIVRSVRKRKNGSIESDASLYIDGRLYEKKPSAVTAEVERLVGVDSYIFGRSLYSMQNGIDSFLNLPKSERKLLIDRMLGIERLREASKKALSVRNILKKKASEISSALEASGIEEKRKDLALLEQKVAQLRKEEKNAIEQLETLAKEEGKIKTTLKEVLEIHEKWDSLRTNKERLKALVMSFKEAKEREPELKERLDLISKKEMEISKELENLEGEIKRLRDEERGLLKELSYLESLRKESNKLKVEVEELSKTLDKYKSMDLTKIIENIEARILSETSQLNSEEREVELAKKAVLHLKEAKEGRCPTCNTELGEDGIAKVVDFWNARIRELQSSINRRKSQINSLKDKLNKAEKHKKEQDRVAQRLELLKERLSSIDYKEGSEESLKKDWEKIRANLSSYEKILKEKQASFYGLRNEKSSIKKLLEDAAKHDAHLKKLEAIKKELLSLSYDPKRKDELERSYLKVSSERKALEARVDSLKQLLRESLKRFEQTSRELERLEALKKKMDKALSYADTFSAISEFMDSYQGIRREKMVRAINDSMKDLWNMMYPYEDYVEARIHASAEDYSLMLYNGTEWKEVSSVASGGERTAYALCLRVALSLILSGKLRILILDEPTHNLDATSISSLVDIMRERLPVVVRQAFIVTHDERLMAEGLGRVFLFNRGEGKLSPTYVEELS